MSPGPMRLIWLKDYFRFSKWLLSKFKVKMILEAGCGTGITSIPFAVNSARVVLLDISSESLRTSKNIYRLLGIRAEFVRGDIFNIPFKKNAFDLTYNDGVLEHFKPKDCIKILKEMKRVGKLLIVSVPYWWNIGGLLTKLYCKIFREKWPWGEEIERDYRKQDLVREFRSAEINVKFITKIGRTAGIGSLVIALLTTTSSPLLSSLTPFARRYVKERYIKTKPHDLRSFLRSIENESKSIIAKLAYALAKTTGSWDNLIVGGVKNEI